MTTNVGTLLTAQQAVSTVLSGSSGTITTTATVTTTASGGTTTPSSCPESNTTAVGAGVGASLGVAFLVSLAILILRERTRPKLHGDDAPRVAHELVYTDAGAGAEAYDASKIQAQPYRQPAVHELQN
jgi:hypothetical protein